MKIQFFFIALFLVLVSGLNHAASNYSTENHKSHQVAECYDFQNRIQRYEGPTGFVQTEYDYGFVVINTKNHKIRYPSHMCIIYTPKAKK